MKQSIGLFVALAFSAVAYGQDQQPFDPDRGQPTPMPENAGQFTPQNEVNTNGLSEEAIAELLQEVMRAREALSNLRPEDGKSEDANNNRRVRGFGSRGTAGSGGTNTQSLLSLVGKSSTNRTGVVAGGLRLNFRNASLSLVLDYLSDAAGFVISANSKVDLQGKVTVWANQAVSRDEAIRILNSSLGEHGYAATVEGNVLNIYVLDATNTQIAVGVPNNDYTNVPPTQELVTQIVYVHNVEANQLITSLQPLMPNGTSMSANQGANAIVITDTKANIRRMVQLVKALDTASVSASSVKVFQLTYADATAMAQVVQQLFQSDSNSGRNRGGFGGFGGFPGFGGFGGDGGRRDGGGGGGGGGGSQNGRMTSAKVLAVADERANALVVTASDEQMTLVAELVKQMDVNVDDIAELRVFRLRNADPQEIADQLATLFPDPNAQQNSGRGGFRGFFGGFGDRGGNNRGNNSSPESRRVKQSRVLAVPDPRTQSIIVSASRDVMQEIDNIIFDLDSDPAKKKKVYVIEIKNRDPQELVDDLQSVIASDTSSGNFSTARSSGRQGTGSQLGTRQQQNLQNQGNNNNSFGNSFGNTGGGGSRGTGR